MATRVEGKHMRTVAKTNYRGWMSCHYDVMYVGEYVISIVYINGTA